MIKESFRHDKSHRTARRHAPASKANPLKLKQLIKRPARYADTADFFDFGACDRLMVRDDRKCLDGRAAKLSCLNRFLLHQKRHIRRCPKRKCIPDLDDIHPPAKISFAQVHQCFGRVAAMRHPVVQIPHGNGLGGCKENCLDHPLLFGNRGRFEQAFLAVIVLFAHGASLFRRSIGAKVSD